MRYRFLIHGLVVGVLAGAGASAAAQPAADAPPSVIAFASCVKQGRPQPGWHGILAQQPDLMLMLGDNIYADTTDMGVMHRKYRRLGRNPGFQRLRQEVPILATWDDHDFGKNNAGRHYPMKQQSQQAMLSFFNEPADSPRWHRPGVYRAWRFGPPGERLQVILLDTRYFRDKLRTKVIDGDVHNIPREDGSTTLLGEAQWQWLQAQLKKPATVRLIGSSIQVVATEHRFEKWHNFPHERERLFRLIEETEATGVVFVSGDRHLMEMSVDRQSGPYPMYDFTSSGLNSAMQDLTQIENPNRYRIGQMQAGDNFGLVRIDWQASPVTIVLEGRTADGRRLIEHTIPLDALTFDKK